MATPLVVAAMDRKTGAKPWPESPRPCRKMTVERCRSTGSMRTQLSMRSGCGVARANALAAPGACKDEVNLARKQEAKTTFSVKWMVSSKTAMKRNWFSALFG